MRKKKVIPLTWAEKFRQLCNKFDDRSVVCYKFKQYYKKEEEALAKRWEQKEKEHKAELKAIRGK